MSRAEVWFVLKVVGVVALAGLVWAALPGCKDSADQFGARVCPAGGLNVMTGEEMECGGTCGPCDDYLPCRVDNDCASGDCYHIQITQQGVCLPTFCSNGFLDGSIESDVDCSWACRRCFEGERCNTVFDCNDFTVPKAELTACVAGRCAAGAGRQMCLNEYDLFFQDGTVAEHVSCGGLGCEPCGDFDSCIVPTDCATGYCGLHPLCANPSCDLPRICMPGHCENGVQDEGETDIDCSGGCPFCFAGARCDRDFDCSSAYCLNGICQEVGRDVLCGPDGCG